MMIKQAHIGYYNLFIYLQWIVFTEYVLLKEIASVYLFLPFCLFFCSVAAW